jgi:hypothetical protein
MTIFFSELARQVLRATASTTLRDAFRAVFAQERPADWLLLCDLGPGRDGRNQYGVLAPDQLLRLQPAPDDARRLGDVVQPSPQVEAEDGDVQALRQAGTPTGFYVVLRAGALLGVLRIRRGAVLGREIQGEQFSPADRTRLQPFPQRSDRYVNTSFYEPGDPAGIHRRLDRSERLTPGSSYSFGLAIGEYEATSIELQPAALPAELLESDIELDVVIFSEDFTLEPGGQQGVLFVPTIGPAHVRRQAAAGLHMPDRLMFRLTAPDSPGIAALRCSIYCRGLLVQSRLVQALVGEAPPAFERGDAQQSTLDFNLSSTLARQTLGAVAPQRMSMMLNSMDDGSHSFRLVAPDSAPGAEAALFTGTATLSPTKIADMITLTRERLREVAWGAKAEWSGEAYRYGPDVAADERARRFREDLKALARRGAQQYSAVIGELAGSRDDERRLHGLLRSPGMIQIASRISASDVVPAAMFYDSRLDTQAELTICPAFEASLAGGRPLIDEPCFRGECPSRDQLSVVCPSGFWGFRHEIGMPYPVRPRGPEMAVQIAYHGKASLDVAFFKDFPQGAAHIERLSALGLETTSASPRADVFALFTSSKPQLVYFYCHGVDRGSVPFIRVGAESGQDYIATDNFLNYDIDWSATRPLVIINGCHTAALSPERALDFVRAFVEDTVAAGVIGTEITVFEPLAQTFAETFLAGFVAGLPLGRAVRQARLTLLGQQNPLGLVYIPYAYAGLRLVQQA